MKAKWGNLLLTAEELVEVVLRMRASTIKYGSQLRELVDLVEAGETWA